MPKQRGAGRQVRPSGILRKLSTVPLVPSLCGGTDTFVAYHRVALHPTSSEPSVRFALAGLQNSCRQRLRNPTYRNPENSQVKRRSRFRGRSKRPIRRGGRHLRQKFRQLPWVLPRWIARCDPGFTQTKRGTSHTACPSRVAESPSLPTSPPAHCQSGRP